MVNQKVLEYLRVNRGNYKIEDLKKKVLSAGYSQQEIIDALNQLNLETKGTVPSVDKTINQINKTNITQEKSKEKPKKKLKKKMWIIIGGIALLLILLGAIGYFLRDYLFGLFG